MKKFSLDPIKRFFRTQYTLLIVVCVAAFLMYTVYFLYSTVYRTIFSDADVSSFSSQVVAVYDDQLSALISAIKEHQLQEVPAEIPTAPNPFFQETTENLPPDNQKPRPL
ncbi:MAG: hypothetical protein A3F54_02065 [Candidatus Kerfeldbacteria bacterium RIFCSPHIGHO2_12_FULL_48_17]|uniref:Uncharacterized protein n=1 Tax=Candidatus Kerfeldbacteria bacterium RIFCSPHIGHO2_12_FULL_48_17 TaxID=1798542 RepID=A0A1G2AWV5_9BACT|nr:MAG: hypothetical protein A3F54_02065 [Candidatus Kerfeldbacteria bacterium RIFCSPHIGHO2_12_FULL_48_17]